MVRKKRIDRKKLKPDFEPVDFHALYLRGLDIAGMDTTQSIVTLGDLQGEGFQSEDVKDAKLHTIHINRLLFR